MTRQPYTQRKSASTEKRPCCARTNALVCMGQIAANTGPYAQYLNFSPGAMHGTMLVCYDCIEHESGWRERVASRHAVSASDQVGC